MPPEHDHRDCPNFQRIKDLETDINRVRTQVNEIDKSHAVTVALIKEQYRTIMASIDDLSSNYKQMNNGLSELYRKFEVNDLKTNQSSEFIQKVTWGMVSKIGTLVFIIAVIYKALFQGG